METRRTALVMLALLAAACAPHERPSDDTTSPSVAPSEAPPPAASPPVVSAPEPAPRGGCFADARSFDIGFAPFLADVADVDGDDAHDLVAMSILGRDLAFVRGDAAGGFTVGKHLVIEDGERFGVLLGELDGDGKVDLVMFDPQAGEARIRRGDGHGDFALSEPFALGKRVFGGALVDIDGDGALDLVTQHAKQLGVHRGRGGARFETVALLPIARAPEYVRPVDLDRDGLVDLVSASNDDGVLSHRHGLDRARLTFDDEHRERCGDGPHELAVGDFDGDGQLDAAVATMHSDELCVFRQQRSGAMELVVREPMLTEGLEAADLDDDGTAELVVLDTPQNGLRVLGLARERGETVLHERDHATTGHAPHAVWLRELDGDGRLDALMIDGHGAPEIFFGHTRSFEPHDTTVSVALGRGCERSG